MYGSLFMCKRVGIVSSSSAYLVYNGYDAGINIKLAFLEQAKILSIIF